MPGKIDFEETVSGLITYPRLTRNAVWDISCKGSTPRTMEKNRVAYGLSMTEGWLKMRPNFVGVSIRTYLIILQ